MTPHTPDSDSLGGCSRPQSWSASEKDERPTHPFSKTTEQSRIKHPLMATSLYLWMPGVCRPRRRGQDQKTDLKIGTAPSHTAHALIPLCQYLSSPAKPSRFALAPVAIITVSAVSGSPFSEPSRQYLNGRDDRSILDTVSVMMRVPKRTDCARNLSMSSGPRIPLGKPGKFSTAKWC